MSLFDSPRLTEGLSIQKLLSTGMGELVLNEEDVTFTDVPDDLRHVDSAYEFEEYKDHVNLDLIKCDVTDMLSETTFESIALKMTDVTLDGKVKKQVVVPGTGPPIPEDAMVYVNYDLYLEMSEVPIDSSYLRLGKPERIQIGRNTLRGFDTAVRSMATGEKSQFLIHHDYAFGKLGAPPRIPPEATIFAVISVVSVVDCGLVIENEELSLDHMKSYAVVSPRAEADHNLATDYFKRKKVGTAVYHYQAEERMLVQCTGSDPKEEAQRKERLFKVFLNMAVCYNHPQLKDPIRALSAVEKAFGIDPERAVRCAKLFYSRGEARSTNGEYKLALEDFKKAQFIEPNNKAVAEKMQLMENKIAEGRRVDREFAVKVFGGQTEKKTAHQQNSKSTPNILVHHNEHQAVNGWRPEPVEQNNFVQSKPSAEPVEAKDVKGSPKSPQDEEMVTKKMQLVGNKIAADETVERDISVKTLGGQPEKKTANQQNSESATKMLAHHSELQAVNGRKPERVEQRKLAQSKASAEPVDANDVKGSPKSPEDEETAAVSSFLENFLKSPSALCDLGYGHTPDERHCYKQQCDRLGLVYEEVRRGPLRREVIIKKKL